jgi:inner membrane protease subunit 2
MTSKLPVRPLHINTALKYASLSIFGAATLATINYSILEVYRVDGNSMSPTLSPRYHETRASDRILILRREFSAFKLNKPSSPTPEAVPELRGLHVRNFIQRGDIITFMKPHKPEEGESVKRVVGVAGDTIWRDVRRVGRERKSEGKTARDMGMAMLPAVVKVPIGHVWVEGDNWRDSLDSNDFGAVS